jgi:outer membrane receptor for ferrienterochelin and colicins
MGGVVQILTREASDGAKLGVAWDTAPAGVQAMLFDNRVKNLILPRATAVTTPRQVYVFENVERARLRGAEVASTMRVAAALTLTANYQYLDARDGHGARLEKRPRHALGATTTALQPVPSLTYAHVHVERDIGQGLRLLAGVRNLGDTNPAERSPLYTWGDAPRSVRVALRGRW